MNSEVHFPDLARLVRPRNILVVGGSRRPNSEGARLLDNLAFHSRLEGELFVVNPSMESDEHFRCWPSIAALPPVEIDVALIMVRVSLVLDALRECAARRIPFAVVMSSGFGEAGPEGLAIEAEIKALCAASGMRVYGPNCPGLTNLRDRVGMTFSPAFKSDVNVGGIGVVTQGGGSGRNILQGLSHGVGAGLWLSAGNEVDLGAPDFIAHMALDPAIHVIAVLLEGVSRGRDLIAALKLARSQGKPVVVMKLGRSEYGVRAAQSHTGSIAGTPEVNSAVFRQFGAIEVDELDDLVAVAQLLASPRRPASRRLAIVTFSGGTAGMAADQVGVHGLELAKFDSNTLKQLREALPAYAAVDNPVDVTSDALKNMDALAACLRTVAADPDVGAVIIPIPADYAAVTDEIGRAVVAVSATVDKLLVPVWMSRRLGDGFKVMAENSIPPFYSLSKALTALGKAMPAKTPGASAQPAPAPASGEESPGSRLVACNEAAAKAMLRAAGIPVADGVLAKSAAEAERAAVAMGFPVVMKIASAQILHKTEVGGVQLGIASAQAAAQAYAEMVEHVGSLRPDATIDGVLVERMFDGRGREVLVGIHTDPAYGRVLTVGLGGIFVELIKDVAHRVLPIGPEDARAMIEELRYRKAFDSFRGRPAADLGALVKMLVGISAFASTHPEIREMELNPVWVGPEGEGAFALDALVLTAPDAP